MVLKGMVSQEANSLEEHGYSGNMARHISTFRVREAIGRHRVDGMRD
ncbi:hypothetical protein RRSWK_05353 [Rhodopirellula sp. SWK7]|nr:hypothetical protein RRSWK_05353 [Rhodopirellula sp. SWK7]